MIYRSVIESVNTNPAMDMLESVEPFKGEGTIWENACEAVATIEENYSRFMEAVGIDELAYYTENGVEMIYEEGNISRFFEKAKNMLLIAIKKLAEITKKFIGKVSSLVLPAKTFLDKYQSKILSANAAEIDYRGYEFTNIKTPRYKNGKIGSKVEDFTDFTKGAYTIVSGRKKLLYNSNDFGDEKIKSDFSNCIFKYFRNGKDSKVQLKGKISLKDQCDIISKTKDLQKDARKSYADAHKEIKDMIKDLKSEEKDLQNARNDFDSDTREADKTENSNKMKAASKMIEYYKSYSSSMLLMHGGYLRALSARHHQAKAICSKAISQVESKNYKDYKKAHQEGFTYGDSLLDSLQFAD